MGVQNLRSVVINASSASLFTPVTVRGTNIYTLGTNMLSWDESNNYTLDGIAATFGQAVQANNAEQLMFKCGDTNIPAFDFGLLFTCFTAIVGAYTEQGTSVFTQKCDTSVPEIDITWFGNNAVIYCRERSLIIPLKSADVQNACRYNKVKVENFTAVENYYFTREKLMMSLQSERGELLCTFPIPLTVQRAFSNLFDDDPTNDYVVDDPATPWDERSPLGSLIANSVNITSAEETAKKYQERSVLESVVVRSDLICTPTQRYKTPKEFLGSLCYSDKGVIALAVNFRNSLFVYQPWFTGEMPSTMQVDSNPKLSEFFNVTEECKRIERFAQSVTVAPLTAAQLDVSVFERIKDAFYNMELPRLAFASIFGRVVIPETELLKALGTFAGENVYCIVPVGAIGTNLICKTPAGRLYAMTGMAWNFEEAFYDITEVVK